VAEQLLMMGAMASTYTAIGVQAATMAVKDG